jgi:hypothetical protein
MSEYDAAGATATEMWTMASETAVIKTVLLRFFGIGLMLNFRASSYRDSDAPAMACSHSHR